MKLEKTFSIPYPAVLATMVLFPFSTQADPVSIPEPPMTREIIFLTSFAIFLEALCILFLLRRFHKPRFFVLWILGLHLITYPAFLDLVWLFQNLRPAFAVLLGEGSIVIIEGMLIFVICNFIGSPKSGITRPSLLRCLLVSLAGNVVSAAAFPGLLAVYEHFAP
jgi:hypothetical protein